MTGPSPLKAAFAATVLCGALLVPPCAAGQADAREPLSALFGDFREPPPEARPWVYWYWASGNVSREGITRDLEAMARAGIGEALIGCVELAAVPRGDVRFLSEEWWSLVEHAVREAGRVGVRLGFFNCPGWSQSGGPWVTSESSMRHLVFAEHRVTGPAQLELRPLRPAEPWQDVAVLAFPAPRDDGRGLASLGPRVTSSHVVDDASRLCDGDLATPATFPPRAGAGRERITIDLDAPAPFTARSLVLHPAGATFAADCELLAGDGDSLRSIRTFTLDRSSTARNVGPMPHGPVAIAFEPRTATRFRLVLTQVRGRAGLAEIELTGAARLERWVEKQLGKMAHVPVPPWDAYRWPSQPALDDATLAIDPAAVADVTGALSADGILRWSAPAGEWIVLRAGMTPTGTRNWPAPPEGEGLEVDKMSRRAVQAHFDAYVGKLLARLPASQRSALAHVVADSYEMGPQNWTDDLRARFTARFGYDPLPWIVAMTGRVVGSPERSDRFLWDLRRLVADAVANDYVGGLRDACNAQGLTLWLQNYGHWGFPSEPLLYGGAADRVSGEFWATGDLGRVELRAAASASHVYGKPIVSAEAFTGGPPFTSTPWSLKRRGDWASTEGANHFVLHLFLHQPWEDRRPGINADFGTEFNRHNTWFGTIGPWIDYWRRTHALLQKGRHVADVAYYVGEDAPLMTPRREPALPPGHDFDDVNSDVLATRLAVANGRFVLAGGASYRLLVLPESDSVRPEVLERIRDLVAQGGAILGSPPVRSPSLEGHPACDGRVREAAAALWAGCDGVATRHVRFGEGRVFRGVGIREALDALGVAPDVDGIPPGRVVWTHRATGDADVYFLSNQSDVPVAIAPAFRAPGRVPELWRPDSGERVLPAVWARLDGGVRVPILLDARGSVFVVLRDPAGDAPPVSSVERDGRVVLGSGPRFVEPARDDAGMHRSNTFTVAFWTRPAAEIGLPKEAAGGSAAGVARNDAIHAPHGGSLFKDESHACVGISVGTNGVVVFEHSGGHFAPVLVHATELRDWVHVGVVYDGGRPALYLDGTLARTGLRSGYTVHPSPAGSEVLAERPFRGNLTEIDQYGLALSADQVAGLASAPSPASGGPALPDLALERGRDGALEARATVSGSHRVRLADGAERTLDVPPLPVPVEVTGPWTVAFPPGMDVPTRVTLQRLGSWTDHEDAAIRCFSGTATCETTFAVPDGWIRPDRTAILDLGRVESIAEVAVNGTSAATLWKPPFLVDLGPIARPSNTLVVRVTNSWGNRLAGAKLHGDGFPGRGPLEFRPYLAADVWKRIPDAPSPAGLIGPVLVRPLWRGRVP
jgi:hypothetical protein